MSQPEWLPPLQCYCQGQRMPRTSPLRLYSSFAKALQEALGDYRGNIGSWRCSKCGRVHIITGDYLRPSTGNACVKAQTA